MRGVRCRESMRSRIALCAGTLLTLTAIAVVAAAQQNGAARSPAQPPRAPSRPDLQGVWQALTTAAWDIQDHSGQRFPELPARFAQPAGQGVVDGNGIPYQPWAAARKQEN